MRWRSLLLVLPLLTRCLHAQSPDTSGALVPSLRHELLALRAADQAARDVLTEKGFDHVDSADVARIHEVDSANRIRLKRIVARHGWPTERLVGRDGVEAAFLLVQHADLDPAFQREMLPFIEQSHRAGTLTGGDVALLTDRILTSEGRPQRYGTQVKIAEGRAVVLPVEDPAKVDERRAAMGLPPLAEYLRELKKWYGLRDDGP